MAHGFWFERFAEKCCRRLSKEPPVLDSFHLKWTTINPPIRRPLVKLIKMTPSEWNVWNCLTKMLAFWEHRLRQTRLAQPHHVLGLRGKRRLQLAIRLKKIRFYSIRKSLQAHWKPREVNQTSSFKLCYWNALQIKWQIYSRGRMVECNM